MAQGSQSSPRTLLWYSPLPPDPGGIALYSVCLLERLSELFEVVLVTPHQREVLPASVRRLRAVLPSEAEAWPQHSALAVYHMGNNVAQCAWIFEALRQRPGLVVAHDLNIHGFLLDYYGRGAVRPGRLARWRDSRWTERHPYGQALREAHGEAGAQAADAFLRHGVEPNIPALPCHRLLTRRAMAVLAHSQWAVGQLLNNGDSARAYYLPFGIEHPIPEPAGGIARFRQRLGLTAQDFLIFCGGFLEPSRRIDRVIEAQALLAKNGLMPHLVLAGAMERIHQQWLAQLASSRGLAGQVHFLGFLPDHNEFLAGLHAADVVLHLRLPTHGETSATVYRALSVGRPVIVYDVDAYRELPDACCWKLDAGPDDAELLCAYLRELMGRQAIRLTMEESARNYVARNHTWAHTANAFASIVQDICT
ncbi:MAG: glycosyltransferase family 4 protein [Candidatus Sumerlaeaceae bacterium]|nr:glycosyltransferase family 4 protein [Candidatus Sumerlaeaceae bacterium]